MKRAVSLMLTLALLIACLSGCSAFQKIVNHSSDSEVKISPTEKVEDVIDRCNVACNNTDIEGILDCIDPQIAKPIRATLKVAKSIGGKDEEDMLNTVVGLLANSDVEDSFEVCESLDVEVDSLEQDGDTATAELKFSYELDGQKYIGTTTAKCKYIDGQWYITKLTA